MEIEGYNFGIAQKHNFIKLNEQELIRWQKAVSNTPIEWIKKQTEKGLPAKEAYEYREQLIEKYEKIYPSVWAEK